MRKICSFVAEENTPNCKDCATVSEPEINRVK